MSTLVNKGESIVEVTSLINDKEWKDAQDKAFKRLAKKVQVPGFRKGNAPLQMVKERIGNGQILEEAVNVSLQEMYTKALQEHNLRPFTNPEVRINKVSNEEMECVFVITLYPEVELGEYKGISIPLEVESVKKTEVDAEIKKLLEENAEWIIKETAAEKGDTVVFDFKGYVDGKEFEGGSADNYSLVLGSNQFIPGFEDQLVGATSESKVTVNVTFPEQYVKELAGKPAKFVCMIHEIKTKSIPELNDEFVSTLGIENVNTVEELTKNTKAKLKAQKENSAKNVQFAKLLENICSNAKITINDKVVEKEALIRKDQMIQQITQNGITYEQYLEITGLNDAQLLEQIKVDAKKSLVELLVLYKVAEVEKINITNTDLDAFYSGISAQYGMNKEDVKKYYAQQENQLRENLLTQKIETFLIENNLKIEEEKLTKTKTTKKETKTEETKEEN